MLAHSADARRFYNSVAWQKCRESYISKVFGMCERCPRPGLIVHHKEHINAMNVHVPNVTLNHDNLEYLCQVCHNKEHFGEVEVIRGGLVFDSEGNLVEV